MGSSWLPALLKLWGLIYRCTTPDLRQQAWDIKIKGEREEYAGLSADLSKWRSKPRRRLLE
jgi:hypothetical protein